MWNFLMRTRRRRTQQQQQAQGLRFTVIAPQTRGQDETIILRENINDLGATTALRQVIDASRPRRCRVMSSQTTDLSVVTHVSAISADSEDYILNPYTDTGRPLANPLAAASPTQATDSTSIGDDYVEVDSPDRGEAGEEPPQGICGNLLADPVGTLLHLAAAATLTAGPTGRQYIPSGPPPPEHRGGRRAQSIGQVGPLPTPIEPLPPVLTQRPRAASSPAHPDRRPIGARTRSARTL